MVTLTYVYPDEELSGLWRLEVDTSPLLLSGPWYNHVHNFMKYFTTSPIAA